MENVQEELLLRKCRSGNDVMQGIPEGRLFPSGAAITVFGLGGLYFTLPAVA